MLSSYLLLLLLLTNQISEITSSTSMPPCTWEYQWSDTPDPSTNLPPNSTSCHLYFSDMLSLVNADSTTHMLYGVSQTEFANCDSSNPIHSVSIVGGSSFTVTINGGPFGLTVLKAIYMISEQFNGGCLQLAFLIATDTSRDCDIEKMGGVCSVPRDTSTPNTTNTTMATNATMATNTTQKSAAQTSAQTLSGFEIFLVIACCLMAIADIAAIGVLVFLCLYLPSGHNWSCEITRGPRGRGQGDRGTEMKTVNVPRWRQKVAH